MIIYNITPSDSGLYQCTSVNMLGQGMMVFRLEVTVPPSVSISSDLNVTEGEVIRLDCRTVGVPSPSLVWYHNGSILNPGIRERVRIVEEETGGERGGVSSLLIISNVSLSDAGDYTCTADNIAGSSQYTQTVYVSQIISESACCIQCDLLIVYQNITFNAWHFKELARINFTN